MTSLLKDSAQDIENKIECIKKQSWLSPSQKWWPNCLFHFTDIVNAVKILTNWKLLSRFEVEKKGDFFDIASPDVISSTPDKWKKYARLYFRPRTPTQYRNEGIRPKNELKLGGAHCPIPIYFIFDSKLILIDKNTLFSDGNLASPDSKVGDKADFFLNLPFEKIYHNSALKEIEKSNITYHRCAEVIIPTSLDLTYLKMICCRSQAEYDTLISLLPYTILQKWKKKIAVDTKLSLFFSRWTFISRADVTSSSISFTFNPSIASGPFKAKLKIVEKKTNENYEWEDEVFNTKNTKYLLKFNLSKLEYSGSYTVYFYLDGHLAYKKKFTDKMELPFK